MDGGSHYARPGQEINQHLLAVSSLSERNAAKIGLAGLGAVAGLLHDLGKYSNAFQTYLDQLSPDEDTEQPKLERGSVDHSTAGAQAVWRRLGSKEPPHRLAAEMLAECIASHHSGLIDCVTPDGEHRFIKRMEKPDAASHYSEALAKVDPVISLRMEELLSSASLASEIENAIRALHAMDSSRPIRAFKLGLLVRFLFSCLIDADRTDSADFDNPAVARHRTTGSLPQWHKFADLLDSALEAMPVQTDVDKARRAVSLACLAASSRPRGIFSLTVPTGGGKTLASLRFALNHAAHWRMDRIIYVSPYTSIVDQNADVARRILEPRGVKPGSVVLEHHSNLIPQRQTLRNKVLAENWDAPVVFTTAVQMLEALFGSGTRPVRRLHQMANAVIVLDEIQTLPVRCVHLFNNAANFLTEQCGSTLVLCTATQPLLHRVDTEKGCLRPSREICPDVPGLFAVFRRHHAMYCPRPGGWTHRDVAHLAANECATAGSCLIVVNTKTEAYSVFRECKQQAGDSIEVRHLSASMCPQHRLDVLSEIKDSLNCSKPLICVSTQLIEAGVDISFGSAIRALAGLDSIAQTAGRCNRHGEKSQPGRIHIINLAGDLPKPLVDIRHGQEAARRVFSEVEMKDGILELSDATMIERYFGYYFFERRQEMAYPVRGERDDTLLEMLSENRLAVKQPPPTYLRQSFHTAAELFQAIDTNTQGVIVPYREEGRDLIGRLCALHPDQPPFTLLRRAQRYSVNVFPNAIHDLQRHGALHETQKGSGILFLDERYYSKEFGLDREGLGEMEICHV